MIDFKCPKCGEEMSVPDSLAGQTEACPSCGRDVAVIPVPARTEAAKPWYADIPTKRRSQPKRQKRPLARPIFLWMALGAIALVLVPVIVSELTSDADEKLREIREMRKGDRRTLREVDAFLRSTAPSSFWSAATSGSATKAASSSPPSHVSICCSKGSSGS